MAEPARTRSGVAAHSASSNAPDVIHFASPSAQKNMDSEKRLKFPKKTGFVYDERMTLHKHDWNPKFNESPERITCTYARLCELGLVDRCERIPVEPISDEEILQLHSAELLKLLKDSQTMSNEERRNLRSMFDEAPLSVHTHEAARLSAGGLRRLTEAILDDQLLNGFALIRPPGHHAMREDFNGFCYLNNVCLSALKALSTGSDKRILIVDWDVHHGQGIQQAFYDRSDVLYISVHRYERGEHWPYLREGDYDFVGVGQGKGFNVNVPLNEIGLSNADYLAIFHNLIMPIATEFSPDLVFVSAGYDCAMGCPLGEMNVHPACFAYFTHYLMSLANGRIVIALEGGYCLSSLSEGVAMTIRTLLGDSSPRLETLGEPADSVKETLLNCITALRPYWQCLRMQGSTGDMLVPDISHLSLNSTHATKLKHPWVEYTPSLTPEQSAFISGEVKRLSLLADLRPPESAANGSSRTCLAYDPEMCRHENLLDRSHPELPRRIVYIYDQLCAKGLASLCRFVESSRRCTDEEAMLFHTRDILDTMAAWRNLDTDGDEFAELQNRYDSLYVHPLSYDSAQLSCGALLSVVDEVCTGRSRNGYAIIRPPGHHAECARPRGFCFINNVVVAARYAQTRHANLVRKVLILDWDVHHGNGVQDAFYSDDNVLYISLHRFDYGRFYPGSSGAKENVGCDRGLGYNVNIPWNGRVGDAEYLAAFHHIVLPVAQCFNPDLVLVSAGFDAAVGDPLGGLKVTPACYGHLTHLLCSLASGRVVLALEGGYNLTSIAEASCHCVASLLGMPPLRLPPLVPNAHGVKAIREVIDIHKAYWKHLKFSDDIPNWVVNLPEDSDRSADSSLDQLARDLVNLGIVSAATTSPAGFEESVTNAAAAAASNSNPTVCGAVGGGSPLFDLEQQQFFAVHPRSDCPHVTQPNHVTRIADGRGVDARAVCLTCSDASENWLCLACLETYCGRYVSKHMLGHSESTGHAVALSFSDLSIWCYHCDSYIVSPLLESAIAAAARSKFGDD